MPLDKHIGMKLKELRNKKGYTIRDAGELTGMHFTYVQKIEKGQIPSLEKLKLLCETYGAQLKVTIEENHKVEIPKELEDLGVEWISFAQDMKKDELSPEDIKKYVKAVKELKNM